jgi:predicted metal-dependent phosphoesterase TrpH
MIDLHCHSCFSDGSNTPEELVKLAEEAGLTALALTDHDTTDGLKRFLAAGKSSSVETVTGIELSAEYGAATLHILGYGFDPENVVLQEALAWVREGRSERNTQMLGKLNALGYNLTMDDIRKHSADDLLGRPHFAAALIEKGHFKHKNKVFKQLLGKNCAAYVDRRRLTPGKCLQVIRAAGGVPVIAHPGQMRLTRNKLRRLIKKLQEQGLGGLEVWHSSHPEHQVQAFERICEEFDLIATGGTDFHGALTPDLSLGIGFGNLQVSDEVLSALRS